MDLAAQTVTTPQGDSFGFDITEHRKHCLLNGLDEIGLTLRHAGEIKLLKTIADKPSRGCSAKRYGKGSRSCGQIPQGRFFM